MQRRDFIKNTALGSLFISEIATAKTAVQPEITGLGKVGKFHLDAANSLKTTAPFKFYPNRKAEMYRQLIQMKEQYGIGRFLFVGPLEEVRFKGFPKKEVYEEIGEHVKNAIADLAKHDIKIGWWCAPSLRSGFDKRFQYITDLGGAVSDTSPCPYDPIFNEEFSDNIATVVRIAKPYMIQFEDDYELSHQPPAVKFGCFCPLHLEEFAKREGRSYTREELKEIFEESNAESIRLRRSWARLSKDSLIHLAKKIRQKVDSVAPETVISLCQSGSADFDGDFTNELTAAFAGNTTPTVRLYGSSYSSDSPHGLPGDIFHALHSIQHIPKEYECFHESDTYPHTRFFMSAAKIKSLMLTAFSYGFDQSLFYVTQYLDNPLEDKGYAEMYRREIPRILAIKEAVKNAEVVGCEMIHLPSSHVVVPYKGSRPELGLNSWITSLGRFGIPYTSRDGSAKLLAGRAVESMDDAQIKTLLSGGLLLDGVAAESLQKMGYGQYLGVDIVPFKESVQSCYEGLRHPEQYHNIVGDLQYNWIFAPAGTEGGSFYRLETRGTVEVVTDFLDEHEKPVLPSMVRFVNSLGGRIVISAFDLRGNQSSTTLNYKKKEIVRQNIEWAAGTSLPAFVKNKPNVFCVCNQDKQTKDLILTLINLSSDPTEELELDVAQGTKARAVELMDALGIWKPIAFQQRGRTLQLPLSLVLMRPDLVKIKF